MNEENEPASEALGRMQDKLGEMIEETIQNTGMGTSAKARAIAYMECEKERWGEQAREYIQESWVNQSMTIDRVTGISARKMRENIKDQVGEILGTNSGWKTNYAWDIPIQTYMAAWWCACGGREKASKGWQHACEAANKRRGKVTGFLVKSLESASEAPQPMWDKLAKTPLWLHYHVIVCRELWDIEHTQWAGHMLWTTNRDWPKTTAVANETFCRRVHKLLSKWRWRDREPPLRTIRACALQDVELATDAHWGAAIAVNLDDQTLATPRDLVDAIRTTERETQHKVNEQIEKHAIQALCDRTTALPEEARRQVRELERKWDEGTENVEVQEKWRLRLNHGTEVWHVPYTTPQRVLAGIAGKTKDGSIKQEIREEVKENEAMKWPVRTTQNRFGWNGKVKRSKPDTEDIQYEMEQVIESVLT